VNHIDFLDIDVEGYELSVLNSNNWNLYRPTIVLIEQNIKMEDILKSDVYFFMKDKGYEAVSKYNRTVIYKERNNGKQ
ncbi:MAG: FkbM family methyltransferase, partial [Lachnospiraceae bacterium]|nr:FkbM family methyltransferase [Lachnospiraceae bacterium]